MRGAIHLDSLSVLKGRTGEALGWSVFFFGLAMELLALILILGLLVIISGSMELLALVLILGLLVIIAGSVALELSERDLFKRRLAVYEQLKSAVRLVGASGAVSNVDIDRFAQAMSDMRFLFDEDFERLVSGIYNALLKKHALDALLEKATGQEKAPTDQALIDKALRKSRELANQISNGIYRDMPEHMEKLCVVGLSHRHLAQLRRRRFPWNRMERPELRRRSTGFWTLSR